MLAVRLIHAFDDPALDRSTWERLVAQSALPSVTMSWEWQTAWWETYGGDDDELILVLLEDEHEPVALAPLYATGEMLFFVGSGGSDYLDVLGTPQPLDAITGMFEAAIPLGPAGVRLYHVPEASSVAASASAIAAGLGMTCYAEGTTSTPLLDLCDQDQLARALNKRTVMRKQRQLARAGTVEVRHEREAGSALAVLEKFLDQHVRLWRARGEPSQFEEAAHREFVMRLCERGSAAGWLCLSHLDLDGRPIAFELGALYGSRYLSYMTAFELEMARASPGTILLRHVIAAAARAGAKTFDFGLGDERYKDWYASAVGHVHTFGFYPDENN